MLATPHELITGLLVPLLAPRLNPAAKATARAHSAPPCPACPYHTTASLSQHCLAGWRFRPSMWVEPIRLAGLPATPHCAYHTTHHGGSVRSMVVGPCGCPGGG